jgi:hypothetical protein
VAARIERLTSNGMHRMTSLLIRTAAAAALLGVAACANAVANKEDMLVAAGFRIQPATTPEQLASLKQLPAHKFVWKSQGDKLLTLYADPTICGCLYVGDQKAFQSYQQEVFAKRIADENATSAMENDNAALMNNWAWGPWGGVGIYPWY